MSDTFTLENHIRVLDAANHSITVSPDPDGIGMVTLSTHRVRRDKEFYGAWELTLLAEQAMLLATAIERTWQHVANDLSNATDGGFNMVHYRRVYDDSNGVFIQVSPGPIDYKGIRIDCSFDEECLKWYGPIDITFPEEQALLLAKAIRKILSENEEDSKS